MARTENYIQCLKQELKRQKIRYSDLAQKMTMSESGLKKALNSNDISFERLQKILDLLGLSLSEFEGLANQQSVQEIELSEKQQKDLIQNFDVFSFYWKIAVEGKDLEKVKTQFSLSHTQVVKYLRRLDELNLIRWKEGQSFKKVHTKLVRWVGEGPLLDYIRKEWGHKVIVKSLSALKGRTKSSQSLFQLKYLTLTESQIMEFIEELSQRGDQLSVQSAREAKIRPEGQLIQLGLIVAMTPMNFVDKI
ncbi:MAG: helix-turn-helix domain-containing protein [Pseudobdellovibrionaceae bacterium]